MRWSIRAPREMGFFGTLIFLATIVGVCFAVGHFLHRYRELEAELLRTRRQRSEVIDFLNHFSRSVATVAEIDHAMQLVAHYLADVLGAESLGIYTVDPNPADADEKRLRGAAVAGMFPLFHGESEIVLAKVKYRLEHLKHEFVTFGDGILGRVAATDSSVLVRDAATYGVPEEIPPRVHTLMAVPMRVENQLHGVVCAVNCREEARVFEEEDLQMLETLSYQAALASNLVNVYSERSKQERILQELHFGREIQRSLLPAQVPEWGSYDFTAFGKPALEVAGDYYDFVEIDENRLMIVVADATGKGVPACMLMAMCRSFVRSLVERYAGLEHFLKELNLRLFRGTDAANFLTMGLVVIDKKTHVCEYGCAGHPPLLIRTALDKTLEIKPEGPALGLLPNEFGVHFDTLTFLFNPGTSLLLFTDGITEALNRDGTEFGQERLKAIWDASATAAPEEMSQNIVDGVKDFVGDTPQSDDQTMVIVSLAAEEPTDA
ncbi:MAG: SpoIIE family protein phosphatase [Lentisphaerae bacterium]|nr:SpoIIE family protein phosphatase [Lentisphaerota bacterium]MBT7842598.1 SpoIIE family protein phosphatase [Lentisphaerota bacterium]